MRADDATGRMATKRSDKRCMVVLGVLKRRKERNRETVKAREKNVEE